MIARVLVNDLEGFATAGRKQKVVTPDVIGDNGEHRAAAIGIDNVSGCQVNLVRVIKAATGRKPFVPVLASKCDQICDLFAFEIDDAKELALFHFKGGAGLRLESSRGHEFKMHQCANGHFWPAFPDGGVQSADTARPEYWRASDWSPKSLKIGLTLPWSAISRARIFFCIRFHFPSARSRSNCSCGLKTSAGHEKRRAWRELFACMPMT